MLTRFSKAKKGSEEEKVTQCGKIQKKSHFKINSTQGEFWQKSAVEWVEFWQNSAVESKQKKAGNFKIS